MNLNEINQLADTYLQELPKIPALPSWKEQPIASFFDQTLLKPEALPSEIEAMCQEAIPHKFAAICVNPLYLPLVSRILSGSGIATCGVVGFPLGATATKVKVAEVLYCLESGATELDMVIPIGKLRAGDLSAVYDDILQVADAVHGGNAILKVILEMTYLNRREKILGCLLSKAANADFVKTSTGFGPSGATLEDVDLMRRVVGPDIGVKAAGGIRSLASARAFLQAGANRIGTSSGVKIIQEMQAESK
ncbi:MAG TPA: deoxyribose-phosphate aldolase [Anaerolineaceae bacterium]